MHATLDSIDSTNNRISANLESMIRKRCDELEDHESKILIKECITLTPLPPNIEDLEEPSLPTSEPIYSHVVEGCVGMTQESLPLVTQPLVTLDDVGHELVDVESVGTCAIEAKSQESPLLERPPLEPQPSLSKCQTMFDDLLTLVIGKSQISIHFSIVTN